MPAKQVILVIFFFLLASSLCAQTTIGVEGGLSYNRFHTNIDNRPSTVLTAETGYSLALPVRHRIRSWLYATTAPGVVQKGYSMNRTDSLSGEYDQHNNTYLQLPIGVSFVREHERLRVHLDLGVYTGYWLYGQVKGSTADIFGGTSSGSSQLFTLTAYDKRYVFNSQRDRRWEEGWWIAPGLQYRLRDRWWLSAGARYFQSLSSQNKTPVSSIPAYNRTWAFYVGGALSLPGPKIRK